MNQNVDDAAATGAAATGTAATGAAARATCDLGTLHGTYLGANDGAVTGGLTRARSLRQSFSGLTATAIQRASFQLTLAAT